MDTTHHKWPHTLGTYTPAEVKQYCVEDAEWQKFRLSLKGLPTHVKLQKLLEWRAQHQPFSYALVPKKTQVQIDNYLNALKRGGQLDMQLHVQR